MIRKKQKLYTHQRQKIKNNCTHKGVPQGRKKLHCGTPFLMVRNLSDFGFCYGLSIAYLREKSDWNYSVFGRGIPLGFTASWRAVLRAWLSVYPTPASSAFLLPRHRLYRRCLWRSFAWRSGLSCR